jgi:hypothetical protein
MGEERAQHGRGVRENVGGVVPSAAVRVAGAGVMMRDQGDKEIRFACDLAVVGCDRSGWPNRECRPEALGEDSPGTSGCESQRGTLPGGCSRHDE